MHNFFETITSRLVEAWKADEPAGRKSSFSCRCGRPVYFRNSLCLGCKAHLGYEPELQQVRALTPGSEAGTWTVDAQEETPREWKRCANFDSPAGCNWLTPADEDETLCRSCRLNRTIPSLDDADNCQWWRKIENAKRRLVAQLLGLGLPVSSRESEDTERGVMFDFLRPTEAMPRILTGHYNGLITLNVEEADDSIREKIRQQMNEPYRTLLGHFRHEIGHYYWDRLVVGTPWLDKFRELFGDERQDYGAALKRNYENGPPPIGPTNTSVRTLPSIPGKIGPRVGLTTCTWWIAWIPRFDSDCVAKTSSKR